MPSIKDPWLAANLSMTFAGLGQLYAGRIISGVLFLLLDILGLSAFVLWLVSREVSSVFFLCAIISLFLLRLVSLIHARRVTRKEVQEAASESKPIHSKNPWLSVFMTRFIPGLGHAYAGRWVRALLFFALFIALSKLDPPRERQTLVFSVDTVLMMLILIDSFFTLRRANVVPRRGTLLALLFILATSQTLLIAKGFQVFAFEVFKIPSSAMEPTLMGDVSDTHRRESCPFRASHGYSEGDRILVSKLAYLASPIERFDVVVFRFPLNQSKFFVKRVVGMPGEELQIHQGDLYARQKGEKEFRIVRKPVLTQDSLWIPVSAVANSLTDSAAFHGAWELESGGAGDYGVNRGMLEIKGNSGTTFRLKAVIDDAMGHEVDDTRLSFEFDLADPGAQVFAERSNRYGRFRASVSSEGKGELTVEVRSGRRSIPFTYPALGAGKRHRLDLLVFDGTAYVNIDGSIVARDDFIDVLGDSRYGRGQAAAMSFGMKGGHGYVSRLSVGRDLQYRGRDRELSLAEDTPMAIPEGSYLVFGDNVSSSHDSRAWLKRTFLLKDGRSVICEQQQINESTSSFNKYLQGKLHLAEPPDIGIDGDVNGQEIALFRDQIKSESEAEPFRFVERGFVVGRVQKIWWPLSRARPIR